jgi:hypothetical protein
LDEPLVSHDFANRFGKKTQGGDWQDKILLKLHALGGRVPHFALKRQNDIRASAAYAAMY